MSVNFKFVLVVNMAVVVLESLLYALVVASASTTLYIRFSRHEVSRLFIWNPVVLFTILISATSGAHWILTIVRFFDAFLGSADAGRFFLNNSQEEQTARSLLSLASILIGDAAIIHRLWIIWNRRLPVIILPAVTCFGFRLSVTQPAAGAQVFLTPAAGWANASWILPLVQVMNQCLLHRAHNMENLEDKTNSGALIGGWNSRVQTIMGDLSPAVVGVVNLIIYLRVELQCTRDASDRTGVAMTSSASIIPYYVNRASAQIPRSAA
ncbi:hypothetical protein C8F04DRAFT_1229908 [Mycena alexandri]|uniref:Uncharacterized protein n=1 Tax=Mycena alexandri TaxID=1745969 RepID=A0AAD6TBV7_9AGAR|nr:hypothetical protein C8F04DRAFT_1229908 [Mycena alexandri]